MPDAQAARTKRLAEPPSTRYAARERPLAPDGPTGDAAPGSPLRGPLLRAVLAAVVGAGALVLVGGILAATFGLLLISGATGAVIGLVVARAAVPGGAAKPAPRATVIRAAVGLALLAIVVSDAGLWLLARQQGGSLGLLDFLWETFGPFVPGEALVATLAAWWAASAGPVQR
jgi:hypothetical protein